MSHLVHLIEIGAGITTYQQHTEEVVDVADIIDVQRINDLHTIDYHIIGVELRLQSLSGEAPDAFFVLHEVGHTWHIVSVTAKLHLLWRQEVAGDLYFLCLRGNQVECHGVVGMHIR